MEDSLRKTGVEIIGRVPWSTHFCQFYQTKSDLAEILVPFLKAGLENNEYCIWITSDPLNTEEAIAALEEVIPSFRKSHLEKGQIEILPYDEWYLKGGSFGIDRVLNSWTQKLNQALSGGYDGIRVTGNTAWLEKKDWKSFTDYEASINEAIGQRKMLVLCTYSLDKCTAAEIMDVIRNHEFAIVKQEGKWQIIENAAYKATKQVLIENQENLRKKLDSVLSPEIDIGELELADIIDAGSLQFLLEKLYAVTKMGVGIIDIKGNVLVKVGWQEACTQFHRINPQSKQNCIESDTILSEGVIPGEFREYKCKNHIWDIVTPIFISGKHVGNLFFGQYFYDDETIDLNIFAGQAEKYGYDKESYLSAVKSVPRFSREQVKNLMVFYSRLSDMISKLSYSNLKLAKSMNDLNQYTAEIEAANKELENFSYSVSHDLRAPLRALSGFSQAIVEDYADKLDERGRDYLMRIDSASQLMAQLINAILKLSRLARIEMNYEMVNLSDLAQDIAGEMRISQPERQVDFIISPKIRVNGDAPLLRVALWNLMENAWKFTSKCPAAKIEVGMVRQNGCKICYVKDNGVGFDMRYAEKLFQPFQRLHSGQEYPGTGIGLATVHRVIHRHGGSIWAESDIGRGTTFYFTIGQSHHNQHS